MMSVRKFPFHAALAIAACSLAGPAFAQVAPPVAAPIAAPPVAAPVEAPLSWSQRAVLLEALRQAPTHGLPAREVAADAPDAKLAAAVVSYASAMKGGRLAGRFPKDWALRPERYDAAAAYGTAAASDTVEAWLLSLAPAREDYTALRKALARYRQIEASGGWTELERGPALKPGASDPRIAALRRRIEAEIGPQPAPADPALFDEALETLLKAEQARLGVPVTGLLDKATVAAFNIPAAARIATLEANLERARWLPPVLPAYRVEVNTAAATLDVHRAGQVAMTMRVIVGRKADPSPSFADAIESVLFNPPWNVPAGIAKAEIWPKAAGNPGYLAAHDYVVKPDGGLQQRAGPKSALGLVKFELPNGFAVYLHDTPSRGLFGRDARAFSHGCIRVEKPQELARLLLEGDAHWTPEAISAAIASGQTTRARLAAAVPVYILYRTAFVQDGQVDFRADVYDWDAKLNRLAAQR